jgi:hypothetical protein
MKISRGPDLPIMPEKPIIIASAHFMAPVTVFPVAWKESKLAKNIEKSLLLNELSDKVLL